MEVRQISALLAVADHGSFSAAADALHTVQSNVSAHIARLEKELGISLFDRSAGRLTEQGDVVARRARRIMSEFEAVKADLAALGDEVVGDVRVGLIGTAARWLLPQILGVMEERYPQIDLRVGEATTTVLEPQLVSGAIDLAVVLLPMRTPDVITEPLFEEDMVLVVRHGHPLAALGEIDMTALADTPLLLPPTGTASRTEIDKAARSVGVSLKAKAEVDGVRLISSVTFDGHGPAILPATALPSYLRQQWAVVRVEGLPRRVVGLAQRRRSYPSAPTKAFREVLTEVVNLGLSAHPGLYAPSSH